MLSFLYFFNYNSKQTLSPSWSIVFGFFFPSKRFSFFFLGGTCIKITAVGGTTNFLFRSWPSRFYQASVVSKNIRRRALKDFLPPSLHSRPQKISSGEITKIYPNFVSFFFFFYIRTNSSLWSSLNATRVGDGDLEKPKYQVLSPISNFV